MIATTSLLMAAISGFGRPPGPINPIQASASISMPDSFSVGISGRKGERAAVDTASTFTLPALAWTMTEIAGRQPICASLRMTAVIACGELV